MERVEEHMGVEKEVASFRYCREQLSIWMGLIYQAAAAVFVCQALGSLHFSAQLTIVLTALLASIGSAAVPGAGMVMLVIVLESITSPPANYSPSLRIDFCRRPTADMLAHR
jgi:Na+/H+-dicarboxylate symporter